MKKNLVFLPLIMIVFFANLNSENIHVTPGQIFPGTQVTLGIQGGNVNAQSTYSWNFGDGTPPVSGPQASVTHVFKEPGNYEINCDKATPGGETRNIRTRVTVTERRTVGPVGSSFMAGTPVTFETGHFVENTLNWDFGDGTVNNGPRNREHSYSNPGNYTVKVKDYGGSSSSVITCTVNVIPDNRSMNYQPPSPMAGQEITFNAVNFSSSNLKWDFGDGAIQNGGASKDHTYSSQGNYKVRITDLAIGNNSYIEETVNVAPDNRSINMNPPNPSLYEEVTFNAVNFNSGSIEWDFDRGEKKTGGPMQKFTFTNMGSYTVKAKEAGSPAPFVTMMVSVNQDKRKIQIQPPSALVGQQVMIRLQNSTVNTITWKVGNDTPVNNSPVELQYKFKDPGRVEVVAEIQGQSPVREFININDNRSLTTESPQIFEKMEVKFTARNFNSQMLKWDTGDGAPKNGGSQFTHKFMSPGNYTVKVFDFDGQSQVPVQLRVNVVRDNREILTRKQTIIAGSEVEFEARYFADNRIRWNLGDGTDRRGPGKITHTYNRPGMYRVFAVDFDGKGTRQIDLNINVVKDSRMLELGDTIIAGVPVSMTMKNSQGGNYEWKLPEGKSASGMNPGEVVFNTPGIREIIVTDRSGLYPPMKKTINVLPDTRSLVLGSETVIKDEELKIAARNFKGMMVKWDFGDGTPPKILSKNITYKYNATGSYNITAIDYEGKGKKSFMKTVRVKEQADDFRINAVELTFSNGKYYRVVPMKSFSPAYVLKLKINARGIITGNWLYDGNVIGMFTEFLTGRTLITLQGRDLPKLPVLEPGVHSLTFEFTNYRFEGKIPTLRYFVTNSGAIRTISPIDGEKLARSATVKLKWQKRRKGDRFEIAVSPIPFQLLNEKNIEWKETGDATHFDLDTTPYDSGQWIYWQVRMVDPAGTVSTASEISFFKIL